MKLLEFVKIGKQYTSNHGGKWLHVYFKDENRSYRTALYENMRNFKNWKIVLEKAERGDHIDNLRMKMYKGKEIVDADSMPKLITIDEINEIKESIYDQFFGM